MFMQRDFPQGMAYLGHDPMHRYGLGDNDKKHGHENHQDTYPNRRVKASPKRVTPTTTAVSGSSAP